MLARHPLIAEAASLGITLAVEGEGLVVEPAERMTPELRARLVAAKPALLAALSAVDVAPSRRPGHAERVLRGKALAYAALLAARGYTFDTRRLHARIRREIGEALGYRSLTTARAVLGDEALVRAGAVLDGWLAELADADDLVGGDR